MKEQAFYNLENVIHAWEDAGKYGDLQTRMSRAKRWNAYYAHLAKKAEQTESALDSCLENLGLIRRRAEAMYLQNVDCQLGLWEEFSPDEMYDVSFCSMCPAIVTVEDIIKMEQMTKRLCCLITISRGSYDEHRMRMLRELGVKPDGTLTDAIHYYNVLYLMERQPSVLTQEICQERDLSADEILEQYPIYFHIFGISQDEAKRYLNDYLEKYAPNGVLHEKSRYRLTMICWKPSGEKEPLGGFNNFLKP